MEEVKTDPGFSASKEQKECQCNIKLKLWNIYLYDCLRTWKRVLSLNWITGVIPIICYQFISYLLLFIRVASFFSVPLDDITVKYCVIQTLTGPKRETESDLGLG
jgi:hypothetical protein